jgi:hypothetical protein
MESAAGETRLNSASVVVRCIAQSPDLDGRLRGDFSLQFRSESTEAERPSATRVRAYGAKSNLRVA